MYFFQPGHQPACQRQRRPRNDFGLASYLALQPQFSQLFSAILDLPAVVGPRRIVRLRGSRSVKRLACHQDGPYGLEPCAPCDTGSLTGHWYSDTLSQL